MALQLDLLAAPRWAQQWALAIQKTFDGLVSTPHMIVAAPANLPDAERNVGRSIIVQNVGGGVRALCFSVDGVWIRSDTGATV